MKETFDQRDKREQREQRARTKRELLATREKRVKSLADLKRNAIFLSLWFLGCLLSTLWLYPRVPDSLWPLRMLSLVTAIGTLLWIVFLFGELDEWKRAQSRLDKEYQEALDKAMPLKKARPAGQKKKPKGGQN